MPSSAEGVPVERLRNALRKRLAETSFRAVASETGMSPSGLHTFLGGTNPHYSTLRKLTHWYVREVHRAPDERELEARRAALRLLTDHLTGTARKRARTAILDALRDATERAGESVPSWLEKLR